MNAIHTEMRYFQRRLDATRAMADAAAGPCARVAHETLARLYAETLEALSVRAAALIVKPPLTFAVRGVQFASHPLQSVPQRARLTLRLAS